MSNGTTVETSGWLRERVEGVLASYRGVLREDEFELREAMLEYEKVLWSTGSRRAA